MKKRILSIFIPLIILSLLGIGLYRRTVDARPVASGILERDRIELPALQAERITVIHASEGESIEKGDLILEQDDRRARAALDAARAEADSAAANLEKLESGPRPEEIAQVRALLDGAEAVLEQQKDNLERVREMDRKNFNSKTDLEAAEASYKQALANRDELTARLALLEQGNRSEDIEMARSALAAAEASLELALYSLEDLSLKAPRRGIIDSIPLKEGATPAAGTPLAVLLADSVPYARVYIPETWHTRVKAGDSVILIADGLEKELAGTILTVSAEPVFTPYFALNQSDRGHLSYAARVDIIDPEAAVLKPGTPVRMPLTRIEE